MGTEFSDSNRQTDRQTKDRQTETYTQTDKSIVIG